MVGIILCGGQSSRMGSDKGLLKLEANTWAQTAAEKMATLDIPVKVSVNSSQYPAYSTVFSPDDLITDDTLLPVKGPLLGVLSSHERFPGEDLFVLACDMPMMETSILRDLFSLYQQYPSEEAFVFTTDGEPEPLCAIYTAKGLSHILAMSHAGQLKKYSMKFMLEHLKKISIAATGLQKKNFRNFNAHAELNGL